MNQVHGANGLISSLIVGFVFRAGFTGLLLGEATGVGVGATAGGIVAATGIGLLIAAISAGIAIAIESSWSREALMKEISLKARENISLELKSKVIQRVLELMPHLMRKFE